jgi:membrane protease YdiL (CAAX protease family)
MSDAPETDPVPPPPPPATPPPSRPASLRGLDFCAVAAAVLAVEYVGILELRRLGVTNPETVTAVKGTLVIRLAQMAAMLIPLAIIRGAGPASLGLRLGDWRRGLAWAAGVSAVLLGGFALAATVARLAGGVNLVQAAFGRSVLDATQSPGAKAAVLAGLVLVGPLAEEMFFRGGLYAVLRRVLTVPQAILASSLFFAAAHASRVQVPLVQWVGGLAFAYLYEKTGTLFAPVLVHAAGNLAILLLPLWFA